MTDTMSNAAALFAPAVKERLNARVALCGPTGSGKTYTALQWARILAGPDGPVYVIDTEQRSAAFYAPSPGAAPTRIEYYDAPYEFSHLAWTGPYDPERLTAIIVGLADAMPNGGCLVIDSLTHFWSGEGGTLDVVDHAAERARGNSFAGWKTGTPVQRAMVDAILRAPFHVLTTMRSKMEYVIEEVERNGKKFTQPRKVGMAPEQRAGIEYEFTVVADMDLEHRLTVSKSRSNVVADKVVEKGRTAEVAVAFREWLASGVERAPSTAVDGIVARMNAVPAGPGRTRLKEQFAVMFGRPADLLTDRLGEVTAWLDEHVASAVDVTVPVVASADENEAAA